MNKNNHPSIDLNSIFDIISNKWYYIKYIYNLRMYKWNFQGACVAKDTQKRIGIRMSVNSVNLMSKIENSSGKLKQTRSHVLGLLS